MNVFKQTFWIGCLLQLVDCVYESGELHCSNKLFHLEAVLSGRPETYWERLQVNGSGSLEQTATNQSPAQNSLCYNGALV